MASNRQYSCFIAALLLLAQTRKTNWSLAKKYWQVCCWVSYSVWVLHLIYGGGNVILKDSISWFNIVGNGYVKLLQMVVMPLVFVSILGAVTKLHEASALGKISFIVLEPCCLQP